MIASQLEEIKDRIDRVLGAQVPLQSHDEVGVLEDFNQG